MGEKKMILELDPYECGVLFNSLNDKRNQMIKEEKPTDAVDDMLMKVIDLIETPQKKVRKGFLCHDTR